MRGFAITTDAAVAISFLLFAIVIISSQSYQIRAPGGTYLKQLSMDVMTVMEKSGSIGPAIAGNTSAAQEILEATPKLACMEITVFDDHGDAAAAVVKSDCNETLDVDVQTAVRPFYYDGASYAVRSVSWFRKEAG